MLDPNLVTPEGVKSHTKLWLQSQRKFITDSLSLPETDVALANERLKLIADELALRGDRPVDK